MKKKACIVDIKKIPEKILKITIYRLSPYRHPVTLFTRDADWHKLVTDLFYDFVSILLVWVATVKMPSNWKISVT
jgi:hypothetical protein